MKLVDLAAVIKGKRINDSIVQSALGSITNSTSLGSRGGDLKTYLVYTVTSLR